MKREKKGKRGEGRGREIGVRRFSSHKNLALKKSFDNKEQNLLHIELSTGLGLEL